MLFPESGEYWFPGGLAPLMISREADRGRYWEPNVWMHHQIAARSTDSDFPRGHGLTEMPQAD
jgi:hypothetical protein